ncbi:MAG: leucine-rich repeat domain-containing protein [Bacteroidales bacterium]|nr:leucine-rich repeat domain-containing protein [Candidatus Scybalousia scybalohippi]
MKKLLTILAMLLCISSNIFAVDFSAVNSDGKTIYYNITSPTTVEVTNEFPYEYTGTLNIPATVVHNGDTYNVTAIGNNGLSYCEVLTTVVLPSSIISIGAYAFQHCSGLTSITLPEGLISIGEKAFRNCYILESIDIPNSVTTIEDGAFYDCYALETVTLGEGLTYIGSQSFSGCYALTTVVYNAKNCLTMRGAGFGTSENFNSLTIGEQVVSLPSKAFSSCDGLTSVTIPNSVITLGDSIFYGCDGLTSITIGNGVTSIGKSAFSSCWSLESLTIPDNVVSIGEAAFSVLDITTLTIGTGLTSLGSEAFSGCRNLQTLNWNAIDCQFEETSFVRFDALTSLNIGEDVQVIPAHSFNFSNRLTKVVIPANVTSIGEAAFDFGPAFSYLDTFIVKSVNPPTIHQKSFSYNYSHISTPLIIPCGSLSSYETAENWSFFTNKIEDCNSGVGIEDVAEQSDITIYPNPVMDDAVLNIDDLTEDVNIILTDEQGRQVSLSTMKAGERTLTLNTNSLPSGIYFVRIVGNTIQRTEKIIKK